jgi:hypothetical protein
MRWVKPLRKGREIFRASDLGHVLLWSNGRGGFLKLRGDSTNACSPQCGLILTQAIDDMVVVFGEGKVREYR